MGRNKYLISILFFILGQNIYSQIPDITVGMPIEDVTKKHPSLFDKEYKSEMQSGYNDSFFNIYGDWAIQIKESKVNWFMFNSYNDTISKECFDNYLTAAEKIIELYSEKFGKPDSVLIGNKQFRDPYIDRHWGYDVLAAYWKNVDGMKVMALFTFLGGKGEYHLLLKCTFFNKDYPYYE